MRGLKSKADALDETLDGYESSFICLVEIHITKEEKIETPGYRIYTNDSTKSRKWIAIAVRNSIKSISWTLREHSTK